MTNNEKAEQIAKIFTDAQEKLQALLKPAEEKKNVWLDKLDDSGEWFASCYTQDNRIATLDVHFVSPIDSDKFVEFLDKNARRFYAKYVLQQIYERDYMPEPVDWENYQQVKYLICYKDGKYFALDYYILNFQGTLYCTAKPDVQKIQDEMGEIFDWLWER